MASAFLLPLAPSALAQQGGAPDPQEDGPGLRFNGLGRSIIQQSDLGGTITDTDTSTVETLADGNFVLDLAVNAQPNRSTEVQGTIRLRNEFGGFFGAGATVEIRELWARGVIADRVRYRVGDMNLALTPYTLFLPDEDGVINEPEVFEPQREIIDYEEFYTGNNERRLQGGTVDFGLAFAQGIEEVDTRLFIARLRATDFAATPTRLIGGGRLGATSAAFGPLASRAKVGGNLSYVWDDLESGNANAGIRNSVFSFDGDLTLVRRPGYSVHVVGEAGGSYVDRRRFFESPNAGGTDSTQTLLDESDSFFEVGLAADFGARGLDVSAMFVDVGPDFYSTAAQSKRVDYTEDRASFDRVGRDREQRRISLFDLTRDPGIYTFRVANALMGYDPRYSNVQPYGKATPNRRGFRFNAAYAPTAPGEDVNTGFDDFELGLDVALLREIRGQGTELLKDFVLIRGTAELPLSRFVPLPLPVGVTLGAQFEDTSRGGDEIEQVDLTSTLIEAGLSAEVYDRLDLLFGTKYRTSSGRDYVPLIENFNDVRDFPAPFVTDDHETLLGGGIRYRFKDDVYLTVQYQSFSYGKDAEPENDYRIGQVFALYSMTF
ncbi:hypothetical protein BSZ36_11525 [Rubricoccus marinus]|uniref:Uncharacterized protein n=2 Tax=Rubricoccus marinus TaxID=716817 RepID=A0A259U0K4_9BACT|nr:hypothetical protein BSZ36_11525 [Rubricoccus marinus]